MGRKLRRASRDTYLVSRTIGDVQAASRGRLTKRLVKRAYHRRVIGLLRKAGLW